MTISLTDTLPNRLNPAGDPLTFGSTAGADTNDPTRLARPAANGNYLYVPGPATNSVGATLAVTPKSGVLSWITHTPSFPATPTSGPVTQLYPSNASRMHDDRSSGSMSVTTTRHSDGVGGIATIVLAGAASARWVNVEADWTNEQVRARLSNDTTYDVNAVVWEAFTGWVDMFGKGSPGGVRWDTSSGTMLWFGYGGTSQPSYGFRVWYYQDGVPFFVCDPTNRQLLTPSTFLAETGETITIARPATGLKATLVARPVMVLDQTNDYMDGPTDARPGITQTAGKFTLLVVGRFHGNPTSSAAIWDARSSLGSGWSLIMTAAGTVQLILNNAFTYPTSGSANANGQLTGWGFVIDEGMASVYGNGELTPPTSIAAVPGAVTDADPFVGSLAYTPAGQMGAEIVAVLEAKGRALTLAQLDAVTARIVAGDYA